jgi:iron complex transport system permease protein
VVATGPSSLSDENAALKAFASKLSPSRIVGLIAVLLLVALTSFCLGRYSLVDPITLVQATYEKIQGYIASLNGAGYEYTDSRLQSALFSIRFPRIIVVLLVGAALAVAGASYQGMFKNPLVSPDLLGATAGAAFGACLAMLINLPNIGIQACAFAGGLIAVGCVMFLNGMVRTDALLGLILGGILVGTLFNSGTSLVKLLADADDKLPAITFWLMGSFASVNIRDLLLVVIVIGIGFALLMSQRWRLNVLSFGEEEARSLGVDTRRTRLIVILGATLLTAASVAVAGMIGWIGLVVPHLTRALVGPNYRVLLPASMVVGAVFLLIVDNFCRLLLTVEIPIGLATSILGVPFFAFIYRRNMKGW